MTRNTSRLVMFLLAALTMASGSALAGPPLLCHPFDIGSARSLPWDGAAGWWDGKADYDIRNLVAETEALLAPATPVVVRMETLRRAAIYASTDERVATRLIAALNARVENAEEARKPAPLALFDAGYLAATFRQIAELGGMSAFRDRAATVRRVIGDADGYALVKRSLSIREDPAMEFAAALIAASTDRSAYLRHAANARKGAARDELLRRNISHVS